MGTTVNLSARVRGARPAAQESATSPFEGHLLVMALTLLTSLPFLLHAQPTTLVSTEEMGITSDQGDAVKQVILATLYATFGVMLVWKTRWRTALALGVPLLLLLAWCLASAAWADVPALALRRFAALAGTVLIGAYAALRFDFEELERLFCRVVAIVVLASLLVAVLAPSMGLDAAGRLRGVFSHKNTIAAFTGLGLVALASRIGRRGWGGGFALEGATIAGCLLCLVLARSMAPLPAIAFAGLVLWWARQNAPASRWAVAIALALACIAGLVLPVIAGDLGGVATVLGRDADFSGRTLVWNFGTDLLGRNPWIGYGYGVFWNGPAGTLFMRWAHFAVPHAHNGYLQLALDVGAIGVVLFLWALAATTSKAVRLLHSAEASPPTWPIAFLAFYLIANIAESHLWEGNDLLTVLFVAVVVRTGLRSASTRALAPPWRTSAGPKVVRRG